VIRPVVYSNRRVRIVPHPVPASPSPHVFLPCSLSWCQRQNPTNRARRLGNGAAFYGKRRSNFYGSQDKNKKQDKTVFDPTEDYQGPSTSGFFKWMPDEDGEMRPVTRMKNQVIERKKPPQPQQQQQQSKSWFGRSKNDD
jgi:hypothetical protein